MTPQERAQTFEALLQISDPWDEQRRCVVRFAGDLERQAAWKRLLGVKGWSDDEDDDEEEAERV